MPEWICGYCKHFRWSPPTFDDEGCFDDTHDVDGVCHGELVDSPVMWADKGCADWEENPNPDIIDDGYFLENKLCPTKISNRTYHYHGYEIKYMGIDKIKKEPIWEARSMRTRYEYCQYPTLEDVVRYIDYHENH